MLAKNESALPISKAIRLAPVNAPQRGVDPAVRLISLSITLNGGGVRFSLLRDLDGRRARRFKIGPRSCAHACEQRGSEGCALFGDKDVRFVSVNRRLNLAPQRAARATSAEADTLDGNAKLGE